MNLSQLTLFAGDSHASPFPQQGSEEARKTTVISGQRCYELSGLSDRIGLLAKMLLESSAWHSMMCFLTWKVKATPANRLLFQLVPSMRRTEEIESGLLPAATANGNYNRKGLSKNSGDGLATTINKMLPTPTTQEVEHPEMEITENGRRKTKDKRDSHSMNLADTMRLLPTPRANLVNPMFSGAIGQRNKSNLEETLSKVLLIEAQIYQPTQNDGASPSYRLQPAFVEWMMGYPLGWSDIELND